MIKFCIVSFGISHSDHDDVGYQLFNSYGLPVTGVIYQDIQNLGDGNYAANVDFPDGFDGRITWTIASMPEIVAHEDIQLPQSQVVVDGSTIRKKTIGAYWSGRKSVPILAIDSV